MARGYLGYLKLLFYMQLQLCMVPKCYIGYLCYLNIGCLSYHDILHVRLTICDYDI